MDRPVSLRDERVREGQDAGRVGLGSAPQLGHGHIGDGNVADARPVSLLPTLLQALDARLDCEVALWVCDLRQVQAAEKMDSSKPVGDVPQKPSL